MDVTFPIQTLIKDVVCATDPILYTADQVSNRDTVVNWWKFYHVNPLSPVTALADSGAFNLDMNNFLINRMINRNK